MYQNDPEEEHYGTLSQMQYGNGTVVRNEYDDFNRVTGITYGTKSENAENATFEDDPRYEYAYNANGQVAHVRNNLIGQIAESEYDLSNRPCRIKTHKFTEDTAGNVTSEEHVYTGEVAYDDIFGRLSKFTEQVGADHEEFVTTFGYDDENRPTSLDYGAYGESTLEYDGLGRVAKATVKAGSGTANTTTYTCVAGAALEDVTDKTSTTGLVESISQTGGNFTYTYDDNGNIASVVQDGKTTAYTYDALGQLIRVDDEQENATWVYAYDMGGNILSKQKYAYGVSTGTPVESKSFTYGNANWCDQLTAVDGVAITYDQIGNPLIDGTWTYTWENGRQLARMQSIDTDASFVYNENGLRVRKTVNGVVTDYTLHGKNIVHMTQGSNELHFFNDASNKPSVVVFNGVPYSYVKNLQGDIVAILNSTGAMVVAYTYDAWGRPISKNGSMASTLGTVQPFRYRGYVYDEETGQYYLNTRYYLASECRYLSPDNGFGGTPVLLSTNVYTYCCNVPVCAGDPNGMDAYWLTDIDNVYGFGHTSILIKNEDDDKWYYFYWGSSTGEPFTQAEVKLICVDPLIDERGYLDLHNLNEQLRKNGEHDAHYGGRYELATLLYGDYSSSYYYADDIVKNGHIRGSEYNVAVTNCMQVSADVLSHSCDWWGKGFYAHIATNIVPNEAAVDIAHTGNPTTSDLSGYRPDCVSAAVNYWLSINQFCTGWVW